MFMLGWFVGGLRSSEFFSLFFFSLLICLGKLVRLY